MKPAAADRFEASLSILATDEGLEGLEQRGALTRSEKLLLQGIQPLYRHNTVVAWIMASFESARRQGTLRDSVGLENAVLSQLTNLRGTCASVVDDCAAPMPLAYVHFVQVVTDVVLALAPFALFPRLGALSVRSRASSASSIAGCWSSPSRSSTRLATKGVSARICRSTVSSVRQTPAVCGGRRASQCFLSRWREKHSLSVCM